MNLRDFRDADGEPVQPYYAAFMIAHGHERIPHGSNIDFMFWIQEKWRESGVRREPPDSEAFLEWLEAEIHE